jgi:hypothetical protein
LERPERNPIVLAFGHGFQFVDDLIAMPQDDFERCFHCAGNLNLESGLTSGVGNDPSGGECGLILGVPFKVPPLGRSRAPVGLD